MKENQEYYIGLDMGTSSVGWAVTDPNYEIIKKHGKALWGIRLFDEAKTAAERRMHRVARRMTERRARRIDLLQELFSQEICKKDPGFFQRLNDSGLYEEDKSIRQKNSLFNDVDFDDKAYHKAYPTIYHLRYALMTEDREFDVRLVYLAIHHIMKHRGHFLFDSFKIDKKGMSGFEEGFAAFGNVLNRMYDISLDTSHEAQIKDILKDKSLGIKDRTNLLLKYMPDADGKKTLKNAFTAMMTLVSGGTAMLSNVFQDEGLKNFEKNKVSFASARFEDDEPEIMSELADRYDLVAALHELYNWSLLAELMGEHRYISEAKKAIYDEHRDDLKALKQLLKKYPEVYARMFKVPGSKKLTNYSAYAGVCKVKGKKTAIEKCSREDFLGVLKAELKSVPDSPEKERIENKIAQGTFLPKEVTKENGVIPYQLHLQELQMILKNAERYLPFLSVKDSHGSVSDKIISLFTFRIPYYVGPLNEKANHQWIVKKDKTGKIYPWNFTEKVDIEKSAEGFIRNLTNKCTYLVGENVLPKNSLLYTEFMLLNELNNVRVGSAMQKLKPELKEKVIENLFMKHNHVTKKKFISYLVQSGIERTEAENLSGIDDDFKSSLGPWIDLHRILGDRFNRKDGEQIIEDITIFSGDRKMLKNRLHRKFEYLDKSQLDALARLSYKGWGRLSKKFLVNLLPSDDGTRQVLVDKETGEVMNIITALRKTGYNLMELLSDKFGYSHAIEEENKEFVGDDKVTYKDVDEMYISPAVKRPLWQTIRIVREIVKIMGQEPSKIFIEMAREDGQKGKKTVSRKAKLQELYKKCKDDTRDWAKELKETPEEDFRSDRLYLYYTQMGKSMYTGKPIDIQQLFNRNIYDIDHIYPQSLTGDDSLDNRVLVEKVVNSKKGDTYPLGRALDGVHVESQEIHIDDIQKDRRPFWKMLLEKNLISREKYNRLTRTTLLTDDEKAAFIGRQLVETRQSTKACAELLGRAYPQTRIVYTKAGNASRFRQYGGFIKVRDMNDYHHAKDAYINIVVGNVFDTKFTSNPVRFLKGDHPVYSLNTEALYGHMVARGGRIAWIPAEKDGKGYVIPGHEGTMGTVRKWMDRNNILYTLMPVEVKGGLFDQNVMVKGKGQVPLKNHGPKADIAKYGGYNKATIAYCMLVKAELKRKEICVLEAVPLYLAHTLRTNEDRVRYCKAAWERSGEKYENPVILMPEVRMFSLFDFNGFRAQIAGKTGAQYVIRNANQLCLSNDKAAILKRVLKFNARKEIAKDAVITEFDQITGDDTLHLYNVFTDKLKHSVYSRNSNLASAAEVMVNGRKKFESMKIEEQCKLLGNVLHLFQCNAVLGDLTVIDGVKSTGKLRVSKKVQQDQHISLILQSITGFYEKKIPLAGFLRK
jgi:CRISPR-associated endonuclease Csn1